MNRLLSRQGFKVIEAHDGPSALSSVRESGGKVGALLTDIEMEGISGIDLAESVISEFPAIPVLFMSEVGSGGKGIAWRRAPLCVREKPFDHRISLRP